MIIDIAWMLSPTFLFLWVVGSTVLWLLYEGEN